MYTVIPEAIFNTSLHHIKHLYNSFLHKNYVLASIKKKDVNMLRNQDKIDGMFQKDLTKMVDHCLQLKHPSLLYV